MSRYSRINSTKSPVLGAGYVSEARLMSRVERVRVDQCVFFFCSQGVEVPVLVCLRSSCCHVTEVGGA